MTIHVDVTNPAGEEYGSFVVPAADPWAVLLEEQFTHNDWVSVAIQRADGTTARYTPGGAS